MYILTLCLDQKVNGGHHNKCGIPTIEIDALEQFTTLW